MAESDWLHTEINGLFTLERRLRKSPRGEVWQISTSRFGHANAPSVFDRDRSAEPTVDNIHGMSAELLCPETLQILGGDGVVMERLQRAVGRQHPHLIRCVKTGRVGAGPARGWIYFLTPTTPLSIESRLATRQTLDAVARDCMISDLLPALSAIHHTGVVHGLDPLDVYYDGQRWKLGPAFAGSVSGAIEAASHDLPRLVDGFVKWFEQRPTAFESTLRELTTTEARSPTCAEAYLRLRNVIRPAPVPELKLVSRSRHMLCEVDWTPPDSPRGTVSLISVDDGRQPPAGTMVLSTDVDFLGERLGGNGKPRTVAVPSDRLLRVVAITELGEAAAIGPSIGVGPVADVENLRYAIESNGIRVTWNWPDGVVNARVAWRRDRPAEGADDLLAGKTPATQAGRYAAESGVLIQDRHARFVTVFAAQPVRGRGQGQVAARSAFMYASGVTIEILGERLTALRYRLQFDRSRECGTIRIWSDRDGKLPALVLVHGAHGYPLRIDDGERVLTTSDGLRCGFDDPVELSFHTRVTGKNSRFRLFALHGNDSMSLIEER